VRVDVRVWAGHLTRVCVRVQMPAAPAFGVSSVCCRQICDLVDAVVRDVPATDADAHNGQVRTAAAASGRELFADTPDTEAFDEPRGSATSVGGTVHLDVSVAAATVVVSEGLRCRGGGSRSCRDPCVCARREIWSCVV
jgi:hypothetical protein